MWKIFRFYSNNLPHLDPVNINSYCWFSPKTALFYTSTPNNPWKAFYFCYKRKILSQKSWSQGTPLGSIRSLSLKRSIVLTSLLQWICRFSWENQLLITKFLWWWTSNLNTDRYPWADIYGYKPKTWTSNTISILTVVS